MLLSDGNLITNNISLEKNDGKIISEKKVRLRAYQGSGILYSEKKVLNPNWSFLWFWGTNYKYVNLKADLHAILEENDSFKGGGLLRKFNSQNSTHFREFFQQILRLLLSHLLLSDFQSCFVEKIHKNTCSFYLFKSYQIGLPKVKEETTVTHENYKKTTKNSLFNHNLIIFL